MKHHTYYFYARWMKRHNLTGYDIAHYIRKSYGVALEYHEVIPWLMRERISAGELNSMVKVQ
jgi:hypothetical protein